VAIAQTYNRTSLLNGTTKHLYVRDSVHGHYKRTRSNLLYERKAIVVPIQQRILAWLGAHVSKDIPRKYYMLVLGHDLHMSVWADLYIKHFHAAQRDPFTGKLGWLENIGLASKGKVTVAFRDFETAQLVTETSAYGDFKWHEVGISAQGEVNTDQALITPTGIARVAGTQVDGVGTYTTVATIEADAIEVWYEHGVFNAVSGVTMLDRSLIDPPPAVVPGDTVQFTYVMTKYAEA
jgi:hypothetical protein